MTSKRDYRYLISSLDKVFDYVLNFVAAYLCFMITRVLYPAHFGVTATKAFFIVAIFCLITSFLYNYYNVYVPMRTQKPIYFLGRIFLVTLEVSAVAAWVDRNTPVPRITGRKKMALATLFPWNF